MTTTPSTPGALGLTPPDGLVQLTSGGHLQGVTSRTDVQRLQVWAQGAWRPVVSVGKRNRRSLDLTYTLGPAGAAGCLADNRGARVPPERVAAPPELLPSWAVCPDCGLQYGGAHPDNRCSPPAPAPRPARVTRGLTAEQLRMRVAVQTELVADLAERLAEAQAKLADLRAQADTAGSPA